MTKRIRIENADQSPHRVVAEVWDKGRNGEPDTLVESKHLHNPTDMVDIHIHSGRYLKVREES